MSVTLTPQIEVMIQERLDSGRYTNASEVMGEALRLLAERDQHEHVHSLIAIGLEEAQRGELVTYTSELMDEIYREAEEMLLRGEEPDPDVCP